MFKTIFRKLILYFLSLSDNQFHPMVFIKGDPLIKHGVYVGLFSEINATGGTLILGDNCDIASFVSINVADSHKKTLVLSISIKRGSIVLENNVFVGSHSFIGGCVHVGHHSVIGAGTILVGDDIIIPPYSLVVGSPYKIKEGYYDTA